MGLYEFDITSEDHISSHLKSHIPETCLSDSNCSALREMVVSIIFLNLPFLTSREEKNIIFKGIQTKNYLV
jgi:hypothetical protein